MRKPVDIEAQFARLLPYANLDLGRTEKLALVEHGIAQMVELSKGETTRYSYEMNRLIALRELRDAMIAEMSHAD
jgi:hypothetical protein